MSDCSTHAFDVPLKPCPFCGGENVKTSYKDTFNGDFRRGVYCADCCGGVYPYYDTEAEAIAAWNSRAELRSEPVSMRTFDSMETALSIAEKEVEIEELRRENYELCKENEELAHRRAELESIAHGTLTAEHVREATYAHSIHADCADADWQAIADELNSRAERTCRFNIKDNMNESEGMGDVWIECSACHCKFDYYADEWLMKMSYCPNCGAKVIGG